ncbi:hypothetical protein [Idiomarina sp. HP20-50]|uniref:hypothetical protein n=1 Tax=Idiomarina sp. HP20-50 TaxID=3070813 RepID=UPI00294B21C2|nr:hypothetical protein [Idiomarina sp. HP20-50]MDV6315742.1 hypothetical protein [Idiomarina sp. HP20-50]
MLQKIKVIICTLMIFTSASAAGQKADVQSVSIPFDIENNHIYISDESYSNPIGIQIKFDKPVSSNGDGIKSVSSITISSLGKKSDSLLELLFDKFGFRYEGETFVSELRIPVTPFIMVDSAGHKLHKLLLESKSSRPYASMLFDFYESKFILVENSPASIGKLLLQFSFGLPTPMPNEEETNRMNCIFDTLAERFICKQPSRSKL